MSVCTVCNKRVTNTYKSIWWGGHYVYYCNEAVRDCFALANSRVGKPLTTPSPTERL